MTEFSIRQRYRLIYDEPINLAAVQSLTKVYLPIIGRDAFTLYLNWAMLGESTDAANQHADLLDELAMSQQTFLTAREKLEGMGLLKTYRQETSFWRTVGVSIVPTNGNESIFSRYHVIKFVASLSGG